MAPCLISPADGAALDTLLPTFRWDAGDDPDATSLICRNPEGPTRYCNYLPEGVTHGGGVQSAQLDYNLQLGATTTWQVWTTIDGINYAKSPIWSVRAPSSVPLAAAPVLISPSGIISETLVIFDWEPVAGAEAYRFCYKGPVKYPTCDYTLQTEVKKTLSNGSHDWWVEAKNYYGYSGYNMKHFVIQP